MTDLKIAFSDFWTGFDPKDNLFINLLKNKFNIVLSEDPDILIYSCYGFNFLNYKCHRIFYTAENVRPDFRECDFSLSFDYDEHNGRNFRLPLYIFSYLKLLEKGHELELFHKPKKRFCNMVVSNPKGKERNYFFELLNRRKPVDSGGKYLNNLGGPVGDKMQFISEYKFSLAFENSSYPGYTTEKLVQPMLVGSIPIYWGNPRVGVEFNTKSFINVHEFSSFESVVDRIIEIDEDENLYNAIRQEPWLINDRPLSHQDYDYLSNKLCSIIGILKSKPAVANSSYLYSRFNMWRKKSLIELRTNLPGIVKIINCNMLKKINFFYRHYIKRRLYQKYVMLSYPKKRETILGYAKMYNCRTFVETGTFMGDTVEFMKDKFQFILSIELQPELASKAKKRFENCPHVKILEGDSSKVLEKIIPQLERPTLFWLDGHYSSEFKIGEELIKTAKGEKETPIEEELKAILKSGISNNIILIDDARCFTGTNDYPSKKDLISLLKVLGVDKRQVKIANDIIRIVPE